MNELNIPEKIEERLKLTTLREEQRAQKGTEVLNPIQFPPTFYSIRFKCLRPV